MAQIHSSRKPGLGQGRWGGATSTTRSPALVSLASVGHSRRSSPIPGLRKDFAECRIRPAASGQERIQHGMSGRLGRRRRCNGLATPDAASIQQAVKGDHGRHEYGIQITVYRYSIRRFVPGQVGSDGRAYPVGLLTGRAALPGENSQHQASIAVACTWKISALAFAPGMRGLTVPGHIEIESPVRSRAGLFFAVRGASWVLLRRS